jgi:hypothetical protein
MGLKERGNASALPLFCKREVLLLFYWGAIVPDSAPLLLKDSIIGSGLLWEEVKIP